MEMHTVTAKDPPQQACDLQEKEFGDRVSRKRASTMLEDIKSKSQPSDEYCEQQIGPSFSWNRFMNSTYRFFSHWISGWERVPVLHPKDSDDPLGMEHTFHCLRPESPFHLLWTTFVCIVDVYVVLAAPYESAFLDELPRGILSLEIIAEAIMAIDIIIRLHTGFKVKRAIIMSPRSIVRERYIHTGIIMDLITVAPFSLISSGLHGKVAKTVLAMRLIRFIRVHRIYQYYQHWELNIMSPSRIKLFALFSTIVFFTHIVGCGWFAFSYTNGFGSSAWGPPLSLEDQDKFTQYMQSIFWSFFSMMAPGPPGYPETNGEVAYTILTMTIGVALNATAIGTLGNLIMQSEHTRGAHQQTMESVSQYLENRAAPRAIRNEVKDYFNYIWEQHSGIKEGEFLSVLPKYLRLRLNLHLNADTIAKVPFFREIPPRVMELLLEKMKPLTCVPNEIIVYEGDEGNEMYFITSGTVHIYRSAFPEKVKAIGEGEFFGEMALMSGAKRGANVRAATYCELFVLTKCDFDKVIAKDPELEASIKVVAQRRLTLNQNHPSSPNDSQIVPSNDS
eukprot:TRINITY_DN8962_c0_g6_i1.p1 TRINITY_DN8962_c0_g6~~TRINITY_DN8962_c0_g6_i1.p1  ORF type:complete len:562 (+),score=114.61 TRINITY_DN8962_c0_g6_i1:68-1753(+)